jgi:hypothetical protein
MGAGEPVVVYCWVPPMTESAILLALQEAFGKR